jgi:tRNA (cmo5U34)-methyltransferase
MPELNSLSFFNDSGRAERYHQRKGFAPERTERMREVMLDLLTTLTSSQSTLLELGAGTGLFTEKLLKSNHFREIYATDGAPAMLQVARQALEAEQILLHFVQLDFTTDWSGLFAGMVFDGITSSIALHHAADKLHLFQQIFSLLKPQGVFVLGDHMTGASAWTEHFIKRERAIIRLGRENKENDEQLQEIMLMDEERGRKEGNLCESIAQYQLYLNQSGFEDVECIWRDYWLAVFVARKPG